MESGKNILSRGKVKENLKLKNNSHPVSILRLITTSVIHLK